MKPTKKLLSTLLTGVAICCLTAAGVFLYDDYREFKETEQILDELRDTVSQHPEVPESSVQTTHSEESASETVSTFETESTIESESTAEPETTAESENTAESETTPETVTNPYTDSYLANKDMAGWLSIPGTTIDYPVMWTPGDENYYLYRDFNGKDNQNGCLILDTDSCLEPLTTNLIIHGHNMKSGAMFGNLTDYENKDYYKEHKEIILYTPQCQRNYEIISVFRSQVYKKSDNVFKFYKFFQADTEEQFNDFYENIKELSLYDTGVTAQFGDHFITLSTCVYHVEQGRFVVIAKEVEPGDSYIPLEN